MADMQLLLRALQHPEAGRLQPCTLRGLVFWLEDRKIRLRPAENRQDLSDPSASGWSEAVSKYFKQLGCPLPESAPFETRCLWLLRLAVAKDYEDNKDALAKLAESGNASQLAASGIEREATREVIPPLDVSSPAARSKLESLAQKVAAALGTNADEMRPLGDALEAAQAAIAHRMLPALEAHTSGADAHMAALTDFPLGFSTGDGGVDQASKLLRIMYTLELRKLQSTIDETVVSVQEFTANPRTESALGRVGR